MRLAPFVAAFVLLFVIVAAATPPAPPRALASAVEAIHRGGCTSHVDDLLRLAEDAPPTGARAVFLLGYCQRQLRRFGEAEDAFLRAAALHPTLSGYARLFAAQVALEAGDAARAVTILSEPVRGASDLLARKMALARGEALLLAGSPADAKKVLRSITPPPAGSSEEEDEEFAWTWWLLGQAAEGAGDRTTALHAYGMAWWAIPGNRHAVGAALRLRILAGGRYPPPPAEARAERGKRLIRMGDPEAAEHEFALAVRGGLPAGTVASAWYQLGLLRIGTRGAVEAFRQAAQYRERRDRALYWLGQAYFAVGRNSDARAAWEQLARTYPASPWNARALLGLGRNAEARQRWTEADEWYGRAARAAPDAPGADEARWRRGWMRFRTGRYAEAERIFRQYAQAFPAAPRAAAHLYWAARAAEQQRKRPGDLLREAAERYPQTFYGQRARLRLGLPAPARLDPPPQGSLPATAFAKAHEELAALGFMREAADELDALLDTQSSSDLLRRVADLRASAEDFHASVAAAEPLVTPALSGGRTVDREVWALAYPRAFWPQVAEMGERYGVDPYLALAVMREESRFDPRAVSPARAFGLMQLLRSTAQGILGGTVTPDRLMDPAVNIRAGVAYLGGLLQRYDGSAPLAVGAYNSGPGGVRRVRDLARTDLERYVESLPFAETRAYVQRVLESYGIYRWLYATPAR